MATETLKKVCRRCQLEKNYSDFPKNRASKDGKNYACKACVSIINRSYKAKYTPKGEKKPEIFEPTDSKICTCCKQRLSLDMYYKDSGGRLGVMSVCKQCKLAKEAIGRLKTRSLKHDSSGYRAHVESKDPKIDKRRRREFFLESFK